MIDLLFDLLQYASRHMGVEQSSLAVRLMTNLSFQAHLFVYPKGRLIKVDGFI